MPLAFTQEDFLVNYVTNNVINHIEMINGIISEIRLQTALAFSGQFQNIKSWAEGVGATLCRQL